MEDKVDQYSIVQESLAYWDGAFSCSTSSLPCIPCSGLDPAFSSLFLSNTSSFIWTEFHMEKLDHAALAIAETQEASLSERKKLAEETKSTLSRLLGSFTLLVICF